MDIYLDISLLGIYPALFISPLGDSFILTIVYLVAWPLNESEAGVDVVLTESSLLFLGIFLLISMRTASCIININAREVSIKTRSTPTSLSFEGLAT